MRRAANVRYIAKIFGLYLLCAFIVLLTYKNQLEDANAYLGMTQWAMTTTGYVLLGVGLSVIIWRTSRFIGHPSDFFILFYTTVPMLSFLVLHPITGPLESTELISGFFILLFPLVILEIVGASIPNIRVAGRIPSASVEYLVVGALLLVVGAAAFWAPQSAGFEIDLSYDRRLEGREVYGAGSILTYGLAMAMNGFAPFLAFRAGRESKLLLLGISGCAVIFFFWLVGVKAPVAYVIVAFALGRMVRMGKLQYFSEYFLRAILLIGAVAAIEWFVLDGYSFTVDYLFRRVFAVQAEIEAYYLKFLLRDPAVVWSVWYGNLDPNFQIAYHIGGQFFGGLDTSANTNTFLAQLASKGLIGYFKATIFASVILVCFDRLYRSTRNPSYIFLGFLYGLLIIEQTYTIAFVSSGVGILLMLTLFESDYTEKTQDSAGILL